MEISSFHMYFSSFKIFENPNKPIFSLFIIIITNKTKCQITTCSSNSSWLETPVLEKAACSWEWFKTGSIVSTSPPWVSNSDPRSSISKTKRSKFKSGTPQDNKPSSQSQGHTTKDQSDYSLSLICQASIVSKTSENGWMM